MFVYEHSGSGFESSCIYKNEFATMVTLLLLLLLLLMQSILFLFIMCYLFLLLF